MQSYRRKIYSSMYTHDLFNKHHHENEHTHKSDLLHYTLFMMVIMCALCLACENTKFTTHKKSELSTQGQSTRIKQTAEQTKQQINPLVEKMAAECQALKKWAQKSSHWQRWRKVVFCYLKQARVDGRWHPWRSALRALQQAFQSKSRSKPWLTRAQLTMSLHSTQHVQADLDQQAQAILMPRSTKEHMHSLRQELKRLTLGLSQICPTLLQSSAHTLTDWTRQAECKKNQSITAGIEWMKKIPKKLYTHAISQAWHALIVARWLQDHQRQQEAESYFQKALQHVPNWFEVDVARAEYFMMQREYRKALTLYTRLAQETQKGMWFEKMAHILWIVGEKEQAKIGYKQAIKAYKELYQWAPEVAFDHGIHLILQHDVELAQVWFEKMKLIRPLPAFSLQWIEALLLAYQGHIDKALTQLMALPKQAMEFIDESDFDYVVHLLNHVKRIQSPSTVHSMRQAPVLFLPELLSKWQWLKQKIKTYEIKK